MEKIFEEEQAKLPDHLRGRFRFGVQYDEIKDLGPKVKRLFSFSSATEKEVLYLKAVKCTWALSILSVIYLFIYFRFEKNKNFKQSSNGENTRMIQPLMLFKSIS